MIKYILPTATKKQKKDLSVWSFQSNLTLKWKSFVEVKSFVMSEAAFGKGIKSAMLYFPHLCVKNEAQTSDHSSESNYSAAQKSSLHMAATGVHMWQRLFPAAHSILLRGECSMEGNVCPEKWYPNVNRSWHLKITGQHRKRTTFGHLAKSHPLTVSHKWHNHTATHTQIASYPVFLHLTEDTYLQFSNEAGMNLCQPPEPQTPAPTAESLPWNQSITFKGSVAVQITSAALLGLGSTVSGELTAHARRVAVFAVQFLSP